MTVPTGYAFYNIGFEIFCILLSVMLLYRQHTAFNENDTQRAFSVVLYLQILYFVSMIFRVLVDIGKIPKTPGTVYLAAIVNIGIFAYCSYRVFIYLELYQGAEGFRLWHNRILHAIPFLLNVVLLASTPFTHVYFRVGEDLVTEYRPLRAMMVAINCIYPAVGLLSYIYRNRERLKSGFSQDFMVTVAYPLFYIVLGPVTAGRWQVPFRPFGMMIADIFVYIHYTDLLMRERNAALENEKLAAEQANNMKSEFLANMSHEIRTPINAVLGMNEMIIRQSRDEKITTYARNVENAGKSLLSIINDILDFSKIEAGKMEIVEAPYHLSSLLNDVTNMIAFKTNQKGLTFDIRVDESLPDALYGDEVRVKQVVVNVLNNAVKYTHEGGVLFEVGRENTSGDEVSLLFTVTDTGIGIKEEDIEKLFEKFQRVDLVQNNTVEGTGLGLSITRNLVNMMGGDITVTSEYGKGSVFRVRIPQKATADDMIGNFHEKYENYIRTLGIYHETFRAPDAHILVVDDTEMNLTVVEGLLSKTDVKLDLVTSGAEALQHTNHSPYDLILMDQRMPRMDGTETLHHIRNQKGGVNAETPVICLTADAVSGAREKYLEEGFTDYLTKPIEGRDLEAALIRYLPAEKVVLQRISEEDAPFQPQEPSDLEVLYGETDCLDYAEAMRLCSGEAVLAKSLKQFYRAIEPNAAEIEQYLKDRDYKNYTIKVHALKSSARLIGADALSEEARILEACGNGLTEEDLRTMEADTPKLLQAYRGFRGILAPLFPEEASRSKEELSEEKMQELFAHIAEAAGEFDSDTIDDLLEEASAYSIPQHAAEAFAMIQKSADSMDWESLEEALRLR